ncbi:sugar transferase [Pusillimonas sp. SM2304]|uniref:sugar transferase n=1 Tax=Pusillimonas sp. SM2304 TaxID=3073241 RepID=UPI0028741062|nr:sugar transferase [Pusillimonas sp. SM2304]MDS1140056.1 sugar transferase [Pusillimonas sp. SM2304]
MIKRLFDIAAAATALLLLSPVLAAVAVLVALKMGRPILFTQRRPGLHEQPFLMLKFRTMRDATDADGKTLDDAQRLTPFGRWLRSTSLDELPELWNVLKGELSLVGPRPLLMEYLPYYDDVQRRRHDVRPGLTGWAQVNGRNAVDWAERFELDVWYVDHCSFWLDMKILIMTVRLVLARKGVNAQGEATMRKFTGNER